MLGVELHARALEQPEAGEPTLVPEVEVPALKPVVEPPLGPPPYFHAEVPQPLETTEAPSLPTWFSNARALDLPSNQESLNLPLEPLFRARWLRALMVSALSTNEETSEIDLAKLIDWTARGIEIREVPFARVRTLRKGVHCWLDATAGTEPFRRDQRDLIARLERIAGRDRVVLHLVADQPVLPEEMAFGGAPVLLLSDLGVNRVPGRPGAVRQSQWLRFAIQARQQGASHVIAFVPGDLRELRAELRRAICVIPWDRQVGVQNVIRARGAYRE
jgi:hypothetical protein